MRNKRVYGNNGDTSSSCIEREEKTMIGMHDVRKYGYFLVGGIFSLGLLIATQSTLANKAYADEGHEYGGPPMAHCNQPTQFHRTEEGRAWTHHGRRHRLLKAFKQLDLTAEQKAAIRKIRSTMVKDMIRKRADIKIARIELSEQLHKDKVDMGAVESQVKKMEGLKTNMILGAIKAREEIKSQLTPEQRTKLIELMQKSHQDHHGMHKDHMNQAE